MDNPRLGHFSGRKRPRPVSEVTDDESAPTEKKKKRSSRSRNGCLTCRARKIKCDESPQSCFNCERIHTVCPGYDNPKVKRSDLNRFQSQSSNILTEAGIKRSRSLVSCDSCRKAKTKCVREGSACSRCLQKNIPCVFKELGSDTPIQGQSHVNQAVMIYTNYQDSNPNYETFNSKGTKIVDRGANSGTSRDCPSSWNPSPVMVEQIKVPRLKWTFTLSRPTRSIE
ncbi:hypothetical protein F5Y12DRAFT_736471 [Xylaria sp. FL1777]|nr:hypothetical protein F5Y12DRAFT_736471 [Xylaria sp. FL1777]